MSRFSDIEDFTTDALRAEIHRREEAWRAGRCWYCGQNIAAHTCKFAKPSPCPGWEVKPPRFVSSDGGCMGDLEEYWVVDARNPVTGECRLAQGDSASEATSKIISLLESCR